MATSPFSAPVLATTPPAALTLVVDDAASLTTLGTATVRYTSVFSAAVNATTLTGAAGLTVADVSSSSTVDGDTASTVLTGFGVGAYGAGGFGGVTGTPGVIVLTFTANPVIPVTPPTPRAFGEDVGRVIVEIGFTTDPTVAQGQYLHWDDTARGIWGTGEWAPDDVWTDVTQWGQAVAWQRGATRVEGPVLRYEAGTATITLNNSDGRFHPLNLSGPYVSAGVTQVRPMVPVRIRGTFGGVWYDLWRGFADSWDITSSPPNFSQATVSCTDAQKVFGSKNRAELAAAVGTGELSGARISRIADSAGWPAPDRIVDAGQSTLVGTTLGGDPWSELLQVQDTEVGEVYIDAAGRLVFKDRHAILTETLSTTAQAVFGRAADGELPYADLQPAYDDTDIRNVVRITRVGGLPQEARDDQSVTAYLEKTYEQSDLLMQTDTEAADYAGYLLAQSKDAEIRFVQITIKPARQPDDLWAQVFGRDFGDRITIRARPPGVDVVERDVFIRGIAGSYTGVNQLVMTWTLQAASRSNGLIWGSGHWNQNVWVY